MVNVLFSHHHLFGRNHFFFFVIHILVSFAHIYSSPSNNEAFLNRQVGISVIDFIIGSEKTEKNHWVNIPSLLEHFLHLHKIVEGLNFYCSLSECLSVCPALLVNKIPAERMHRFGCSFC